jgi:hypothetical protein
MMADSEIVFSSVFSGEKEFGALEKAHRWCEENGYSYGRLERGSPIGLLKGDFDIQKWRNLDSALREALHGTITSSDFTYRRGPVTIRIKRKEQIL